MEWLGRQEQQKYHTEGLREKLAGELQVTDLSSYTFVVIQSDLLMAHN